MECFLQSLTELKEESWALKENLTWGPDGNGMFSEMKQPLAKVKHEIRALKGNLTGGPGGNGMFCEVK